MFNYLKYLIPYLVTKIFSHQNLNRLLSFTKTVKNSSAHSQNLNRLSLLTTTTIAPTTYLDLHYFATNISVEPTNNKSINT